MQTNCLSCGSDQTSPLSMLYKAGTQIGSFRGVGFDSDGDAMGFGGVKVSQTMLAREAAPPAKRSMNPLGALLVAIGGFITLFVGGVFLGIWDNPLNLSFVLFGIFGIVALLIGIIILANDHQKIIRDHQLALNRWHNQWMCLKCGARFNQEKFIDPARPNLEQVSQIKEKKAIELPRLDSHHCKCTICSGVIEFNWPQAGTTIDCPHCQMQTVLFVPRIR